MLNAPGELQFATFAFGGRIIKRLSAGRQQMRFVQTNMFGWRYRKAPLEVGAWLSRAKEFAGKLERRSKRVEARGERREVKSGKREARSKKDEAKSAKRKRKPSEVGDCSLQRLVKDPTLDARFLPPLLFASLILARSLRPKALVCVRVTKNRSPQASWPSNRIVT